MCTSTGGSNFAFMFWMKGTVDKSPSQRVLRTDSSVPGSALHGKVSDKNTLTRGTRSQKPEFRSEGTSSNFEKLAVPQSSHVGAPEKERKASVGRTKKLKKKYFCFMPF